MAFRPDFGLPGSVTPKYAAVAASSSGDNTVVAAVASKSILVLGCVIVAGASVNVRFEDGAGGSALTGQIPLTTNSGFTLPFSEVGWFKTSSNTLLNLELSAAETVAGTLIYAEVPA